jgi:hypothetical protein
MLTQQRVPRHGLLRLKHPIKDYLIGERVTGIDLTPLTLVAGKPRMV